MKKLLLCLLTLVLANCSAKSGSVENVPPRIVKPELSSLSFKVQFGQMDILAASALIWPTDWTEQQTEDRVYTINKYSKLVDSLMVENANIQAGIPKLFAQFTAVGCIAKFRKPAADGQTLKDPSEYDETDAVDWKDTSDVAAADRTTYAACLANEKQRQAYHARALEMGSGKPSDLQKLAVCPSAFGPKAVMPVDLTQPTSFPVILRIVDCALGQGNSINIGTRGSRVVIKPREDGVGRDVDVRFKNFNDIGETVTQDSTKATDATKKEDLKAKIKGFEADEVALRRNLESQLRDQAALLQKFEVIAEKQKQKDALGTKILQTTDHSVRLNLNAQLAALTTETDALVQDFGTSLAAMPDLKAAFDKVLSTRDDLQSAKDSLIKFARTIYDTSIDNDGRNLKYTVPDMKSDLLMVSTPTGPEYVYTREFAFDLYRVDNLLSVAAGVAAPVAMEIAKFKGDVSIRENGVEVRKGSGQLIGQFLSAQ